MVDKSRRSVAQAYLQHLAARGVDYVFGNGGTDFAPIAEAVALARLSGSKIPVPVTVPHENVAMGMAYGYTLVTGRPQAVMVHVGVGTANCVNNVYNAHRQRIPILLTAGRTPVLESGQLGSRNNFINWAQEMFDQAGMLRELVKWDYELRRPEQVYTVVDRALSLLKSEPQGPVYLTLPREVLAAEMPEENVVAQPISAATPPHGDPEALQKVATLLRNAQNPLIITQDVGRTERGFAALSELAEAFAIPVVEYRPRYASIPTSHPMHSGWDPNALLPSADVVLVLEADVPWIPGQVQPRQGATVIHIGIDPLYANYPIRGFRADISIMAEPAAALQTLHNMMGQLTDVERRVRDQRYVRISNDHQTRVKERGLLDLKGMTAAWLSRCINAVRDDDTVLVNEYPLVLEELTHTNYGTFFSHSPAGGLGWATGAALGIKLANKEKTVIATVGDGAYMFGNPTPTHMVSRMMELPILWIVYNNRRWAAVHRATMSLYPDGAASKASEDPPFANLGPETDYEKIVEACGGYGERIDRPEQLPDALQRALHILRTEKRQVLLNVIADISYDRTS
ncbi:MAG: thiamine pyrophosphate-requiring protein [Pigmentiphaga sp.]|nr:thiamine pyrophosphate-requiring protein [Pigmentiphaga sp.]